MSKFKVGDRVRIKEYRKEWSAQSPTFVTPSMSRYCGEECTITKIKGRYVEIHSWLWNDDWLELVEEAIAEEESDIDPDAFEAFFESFLHKGK